MLSHRPLPPGELKGPGEDSGRGLGARPGVTGGPFRTVNSQSPVPTHLPKIKNTKMCVSFTLISDQILSSPLIVKKTRFFYVKKETVESGMHHYRARQTRGMLYPLTQGKDPEDVV